MVGCSRALPQYGAGKIEKGLGEKVEDWGSGYSFALGNVVLGRECFP